MENIYGEIYKVTNKINGKIYIGQSVDVKSRWRRHVWEGLSKDQSDNTYFHRAINKYGKDNFFIEIIDNADNSVDLDNKEIYWINKLKSTDHKIGYNTALGGQGGSLPGDKCYWYGKHRSKEEKEKISKSCTGKNMRESNPRARSVICIETGKIYNTLTDAEIDTGTNHSHISNCCTGKRKAAGGYHWKYGD